MKFEIEIDGEKVVMDDSQLVIHDVQAEAPKAAAAIFYWGSVVGAIRAKLEGAKADYRQAIATFKVDTLASEPKLAEWKVNASWESTEHFRKAKTVIAHWQRLYDQATAGYLATQSRASMIQTMYKNETGGRAFAGSLGDEKSKEKEVKKDQLRKVMRKKR
jgi:hypothetical protein